MPHSYRSHTVAAAAVTALSALVMSGGCAAFPAAVADTRDKQVPAVSADAGGAMEAEAAAVQAGSAGAGASPVTVHPLTGLPVGGNAAASAAMRERPIMVMVNNHVAARPQSGLSRASVLIECLAEGEITRIVAFYEGGAAVPGIIGPVRSIRPYYIDLGRMFDAIEVHAGGSPDAYAQLGGEHIDHLDEITNAGRFFWRESSRKAPHNLYTDIAHLRAGAAKLHARTEWRRPALAFAKAGEQSTPGTRATRATATQATPSTKEAPGLTVNQATYGVRGEPSATAGGSNSAAAVHTDSGITAKHVEVTFHLPSYAVSYDYDASAELYRRLVNGKPHTDLNDGSQLSATNIVVLGAAHKVLDAEGRREIRLTGSGPAVIFGNGGAVQGAWRRAGAADTFHLTRADGSAIALLPGQTHYLIVPNTPTFARHVTY